MLTYLSIAIGLGVVTGCRDPYAPEYLGSSYYRLSGVVSTMTPAGLQPIAGARVTDGDRHVVRTKADGSYLIVLPEVRVDLSISASKLGYVPRASPQTISGDTRVDFQLDSGPRYTLSGVITEFTPAGRVPIAGVVVEDYGSEDSGDDYSSGSATTDADGHYSISGLVGGPGVSNTLWLTKPGYQIDQQTNPPCDNCYRTLTITGDMQLDIELARIPHALTPDRARKSDHYPPVALLNAAAPPTTGSWIDVASRSIVNSVPGFGHSVKSRSLDMIIKPMRLPAGMIWSSGSRSNDSLTNWPGTSGLPGRFE
jgi:hypothetical protein